MGSIVTKHCNRLSIVTRTQWFWKALCRHILALSLKNRPFSPCAMEWEHIVTKANDMILCMGKRVHWKNAKSSVYSCLSHVELLNSTMWCPLNLYSSLTITNATTAFGGTISRQSLPNHWPFKHFHTWPQFNYCQDVKPEQQVVAEARAVNDKQALDEYLTWRASVDRRRISAVIRMKSDGEVTQGLMEWWSSGDGGYGVSLYCKAKELQMVYILELCWAITKRP